MSFFSRLLGGTFESNKSEAEGLFKQKVFGEAKLAYERALKKGKDVPDFERNAVLERIRECQLELANERLSQAEVYMSQGELDHAADALADVLEICDLPEIRQRLGDCKGQLDAKLAREMADDHDEMSEDDLLAVIAGTWTAGQAEEFSALPQAFHDALLAGHDGDHKTAVQLIQSVIETDAASTDHRYIYLELARQLISDTQYEDALSALEEFDKRVQDDENALDERVLAYTLMGHIHSSSQRPENAERCLGHAVEIAPQSHVPQLNLGIFLRMEGKPEQALKALLRAKELMGTLHPDMRVIKELGFVHLALDKEDDAIAYFKGVIERSASQGAHEQYDPEAAVALAKLYEKREELDKACDIFRHLAHGYDSANHFVYNVESARLLKKLGGKKDLVSSYLARARELASNDEEISLVNGIDE